MRSPSPLRQSVFLLAAFFAMSPAGDAAGEPDRDAALARRAEERLDALSAAIDPANRFRKPGIVADRAARRVTLFARATGLSAKAPVEFILVGPASGHDYEALAVTLAQPSDLCRALEFIGMPRGEPALRRPLAFWPKGERVLTTCTAAGSDTAPVPLESLVFDIQRNAPLPPRGFVYCGSVWEGDPPRCAADGGSPGSVISTYNEPGTVLDIPHQAPQSEVYERFVAAGEPRFEPETLLRIEMIPERAPGAPPRVETYTLRFVPEPPGADGAKALRGDLLRNGNPVLNRAGLPDVFAVLRERVEADFDPYLRPVFDDSLTLRQAKAAAEALARIEGPNGARIDAPPPGQLYYKAFMPDPRWRRREDRLAQPWELRVPPPPENGEPRAGGLTLVQTLEHWPEGEVLHPELEVREFPIETPEALPRALERLGSGLPVILVFAPAQTPLRRFMPAVREVLDTHPTVHVFAE